MRRHPLRRPAVPVLLATALSVLGAGCGGDGSAGPKAAADAPRADAPAPHKVVIIVDGKWTETMTTGTTVRQVLQEAGVALGQYDLVKPTIDQPAGDVVKILRLLSAPKTLAVKVPAKTIRKKSASVPPWDEKVLREGRPGIKIVTWAYVRRPVGKGGKLKPVKKVITQRIKRKPVARVLAVGPESAGTGSAARLNWRGLASCESNNNPKAVNPAGYYGLYQFSMASWASVGGKGKPSDASAAEQTYRAQLLYKRVNGRWQGQWPNCGKFLFS
ncbi:resuscitation-promoting factor [Actinomadura sp. KC06]|uniref:resuscitation-promoting factor n=1 Tax=Actinomadura sp. KC06 TaxID=2530369 RepID=UPI001FB732D0|nr:resuscitation-promoting factor [Actinomadura sp. KC06]